MHCVDFEDRLLEYPELAAPERAVVDRHLAECASCTEFFQALAEVDSAVSAAFSGAEVSPAFHDAVVHHSTRQAPLPRPSLLPQVLDLVGWSAISGVVFVLLVVLASRFGLDTFTLDAVAAALVVMTGFWIAFRSWADLKR